MHNRAFSVVIPPSASTGVWVPRETSVSAATPNAGLESLFDNAVKIGASTM